MELELILAELWHFEPSHLGRFCALCTVFEGFFSYLVNMLGGRYTGWRPVVAVF